MADKEQLARLKKDVAAWNAWRKKNTEKGRDIKIDLNGADLHKADLSGADLGLADLSEAHLSLTDLREAMVVRADLREANFFMADLSRAFFSNSDLREANLHRADLSGAFLDKAILNGAILREANLSGARVGRTSFGDLDLSEVKELETVEHFWPSTIGIDTIYKSKGNIPEVFLRGCGVPEDMIAYARSLRGKAIDFYSCFISHSAKDKKFCERLYADLQAKGVRTWYFPEDAKWGETVWGEIDRSIKIYDKLVVVLSEHSLQSKPVLREIQRSLNREDKEHKNILFPIRIDDYVFAKWEHERKADVVDKVVGDFCGWDKDAAKYDKAFEKLLRGLQAESEKK